MTNYNELVDHQVQSMNKSTAPFDTQAYANYKALVDKEKEQIDTNNITEAIYKLGYQIDTLLSKIISQLDALIKEDFNPNNVTCSIDDKEVDCDTWEEEITVDPLTHKVTYNRETNEYKVVQREETN